MTSLLNLLLASFLALSPTPAAGKQDPGCRQPGCVRDHFGKACIAAQEQFQRKFLKQVPRYDGAALGIATVVPPKR
jgi:hypothetical protein